MPHGVLDRLGRPAGTLRLSVTDRCNLRCTYCMPEEEYAWLPRSDLLDFDELTQLTRAFVEVGVKRVRITGGEPLLRRELPKLVGRLSAIGGLDEVALTTNGVLLADLAGALAAAGLRRITVSLDTLSPGRFEALTRKAELPAVLAGVDAARQAGLPTKLDAVVIRGVNDDEVIDLLDFAIGRALEVRFIEYMDVGGATRWSPERVVSRAEILAKVERAFGPVVPAGARGAAPAETFRLRSGATFGVIASVTAPFCRACDRSRLTADGVWYPCLYASRGRDLKALLRSGANQERLCVELTAAWRVRDDRGAELRAGLPERAMLVPVSALRGDPHLEMHTRGG